MPRFVADEHFNRRILTALLRRRPAIDVARVQDAGLAGAPDAAVLAYAAADRRVVLTHDMATLVPLAHQRAAAGAEMPGVVAVVWTALLRTAIEEILLLDEAAEPHEHLGAVWYIRG